MSNPIRPAIIRPGMRKPDRVLPLADRLVFGQDRPCPTCAGCGWLRRVEINGTVRLGRIGVVAARRMAAGARLRNIVPCPDERCEGGVIRHGR